MNHVLAVHELTGRFGGVTAVNALTLHVEQGETLGVIGPNGAGKSTLVGLISGAVPASSGTIHIGATDITRLSAPVRTRLGVGTHIPDSTAVRTDDGAGEPAAGRAPRARRHPRARAWPIDGAARSLTVRA